MSQYLTIKPMLYTKELNETVAFYTDVLGFTCAAYQEEWGWASLVKDNVEFMLAHPNEHLPFKASGFTGTFYINTDDVDTLWEQWKDKCKICYPIQNFDYGMREFAIFDNNGYVLQFGKQLR